MQRSRALQSQNHSLQSTAAMLVTEKLALMRRLDPLCSSFIPLAAEEASRTVEEGGEAAVVDFDKGVLKAWELAEGGKACLPVPVRPAMMPTAISFVSSLVCSQKCLSALLLVIYFTSTASQVKLVGLLWIG